MKPITTIFFDFGRVLVDVDEQKALRRMARYSPYTPEEIWERMREKDILSRYGRGELTPKEFIQEMRKEFKIPEKVEEKRLKEIWRSVVTGPKEDVFEIARRLKENYELFVISNTDGLHHAHIADLLPLDEVFKGQVVSYLVGAEKPARKIFKVALDKAHADPESCVFIDDLPENIRGAKRMGMKGIVFKDADQLRAELAEFGIRI